MTYENVIKLDIKIEMREIAKIYKMKSLNK
jgi:hypothetical protein